MLFLRHSVYITYKQNDITNFAPLNGSDIWCGL